MEPQQTSQAAAEAAAAAAAADNPSSQLPTLLGFHGLAQATAHALLRLSQQHPAEMVLPEIDGMISQIEGRSGNLYRNRTPYLLVMLTPLQETFLHLPLVLP
jgi:hypothetical protein